MDAQKIGTENESPQEAGSESTERDSAKDAPQEAGSESTERDSAKDAPQLASDPKPTKSRFGHDGNNWQGPGGVTGI
jgi:hypothetical protein